MHFEITEKMTTDCVSQHNNSGLISKLSRKIASENCENCPSQQPPWSLTLPLQGTSANICVNFISQKVPSYWRTVLPLTVWVYIQSNFCGGLRKTHFLLHSASRSSKVVDFGTNRKVVWDFLLIINSNRFRDIAGFLLRTSTPPLFHLNFLGVPLGLDCRCCGSEVRR